MMPNSSKSTDSILSTSSSKYSASAVYKRKMMMPPIRQHTMIPISKNDVRQRVTSARVLRIRALQNELVDARNTINQLANENRILQTLHKRQNSALAKYESTNAELPRLLKSHEEEIRVWETKYKKLQSSNNELNLKLKNKDIIVLRLSDQNKHLSRLCKDKNLQEREILQGQLRYLENKLQERDKEIQNLTRRIELEEKNFKTQLQIEQNRYKDLLIKYENLKLSTEKSTTRHNCDVHQNISRNSLLPARTKSYKDIIREQSCTIHNHRHHKEILRASQQKQKQLQHQRNDEIYSNRSSLSNKTIENEKIDSKNLMSLKSNIQKHQLLDVGSNFADESIKISKKLSNLGLRNDEDEEEKISENEIPIKEDVIQGNEKPMENSYSFGDDEEDNQTENNYNGIDENESDHDNKDVFMHAYGKQTEEKLNPPQAHSKNLTNSKNDTKFVTKDDFVEIHQKISQDYKKKQQGFEKFCQQSINGLYKNNLEHPVKEVSQQLTKQVQKRSTIDPRKKAKLLAALKDIDTKAKKVDLLEA